MKIVISTMALFLLLVVVGGCSDNTEEAAVVSEPVASGIDLEEVYAANEKDLRLRSCPTPKLIKEYCNPPGTITYHQKTECKFDSDIGVKSDENGIKSTEHTFLTIAGQNYGGGTLRSVQEHIDFLFLKIFNLGRENSCTTIASIPVEGLGDEAVFISGGAGACAPEDIANVADLERVGHSLFVRLGSQIISMEQVVTGKVGGACSMEESKRLMKEVILPLHQLDLEKKQARGY